LKVGLDSFFAARKNLSVLPSGMHGLRGVIYIHEQKMNSYNKTKNARLRDLDLYQVFKKFKQEIIDEGWDPNWFIKVVIKRYYPDRTLPQNKYHWALMTIFGDACGWTKEEAHQYFVEKFGPIKVLVNEATGEENPIRLSTSMMDTQQMTEFIALYRQDAMDNAGVYLPLPNENLELFEE